MDVPRVGYDKQYAENYDRIFKKTPKEKATSLFHRFILWIIFGRKI
jgi:hypothetical protein